MVNKIKLAFIKTGKANLPEIDAYCDFFSPRFEVKVCQANEELSHYDVLWNFMGFQGRKVRPDQFLIHEFASLSTPPFSRLKNSIKKIILPKPNLRIFLNKFIQDEMGFNDKIPYCYRDMGVNNIDRIEGKNFDFDIVYVGAVKGRRLEEALDLLISYGLDCKIAIVGKVDNNFIKKYESAGIIFTGQVPYSEVANIISRSKLCLNWVPDVYPYNIQTSTKFLEYLVAGKCIISNEYKWISDFTSSNNIKYVNIKNKSDIKSALNGEVAFNTLFVPRSWADIITGSEIESHITNYFKDKR
ncbi:glycosyltransferase [Citrobacter freundii]|uniref:glycosyltransferase family 4 protein n=1 Tax=Citrobacter TaxID=544 RepID=UPI0009C6F462|nr:MULTISPECIES: glycosyltransferase family 4 protein [Citrobacter]MDM2795290.1 glycosyltransferase family 4 protein [Citrobacter sp. Cpo114]MDM2831399.1 glycosyltransferase family 4 protein [Citrobacter sp. Cpo085]OPX49617.1 glycosyltransferase [Citrobacter portucalensis]UKK36517.1 glycosyltransferase [Citrobacter freundii]